MEINWWQAIVLGAVQGLTEFLPVSSSGHLILVRELMGLNVSGAAYLLFDVVVHVGTLFAVLTVLYKEVAGLFKKPFKRLILLIVASIPAAVVGFLCKDVIEQYFSTAKYLCFFFMLTAILLLVSEIVSKRTRMPRELGIGAAIAMGVMQGAAVFPGLSRSGSTIFGGTVCGAQRKQVAAFSFMMSMPVIAGSLVLSAVDVACGGSVADVNWLSLGIGAVTAFASGYFSVRAMLRLTERADFKWFSLYLIALAALTFVFYFL